MRYGTQGTDHVLDDDGEQPVNKVSGLEPEKTKVWRTVMLWFCPTMACFVSVWMRRNDCVLDSSWVEVETGDERRKEISTPTWTLLLHISSYICGARSSRAQWEAVLVRRKTVGYKQGTYTDQKSSKTSIPTSQSWSSSSSLGPRGTFSVWIWP